MSTAPDRARQGWRAPRNAGVRRRWIGSAVCAALLATPTIVTAPAPAKAADSVFFVSGTRDTPVPQQLIDLADIGSALTYFGTEALQVGYAAALFPFQGTIGLDLSVGEGVASLLTAVALVPDGDRLVLIGVSQGDIVLSLVERALIASGSQRDVLFVRMAGPSGDTGVMGRNWGFKLPGLSFVTRPAESPYDQIVLNHEYDGLGHWPARQLNALAVLNAVLGMLAFHNPGSYAVDLSTFPESDITTTVNSLGATTTTYLIRATGLLPLLRPLQALGVDEALLSEWQRVLKPIIDSAYETPTAPMLDQVVLSMVREVVNSLGRMAEGVATVLRRIDSARWPAVTVSAEAAADGQNVLGAVQPEPEVIPAERDPRPELAGGTHGPEAAAVIDTVAVVVEDNASDPVDATPTESSDGEPQPGPLPVLVSAEWPHADPDDSSSTSEDIAAPEGTPQSIMSEDSDTAADSDHPAVTPREFTNPATAKKSQRSAESGAESDSDSLQRSPRSSVAPPGGSTSVRDDSDTSGSSSRLRTATPGTDDSTRQSAAA